jgi:TonB-linked SusC/RagA family outer membrane protein
MEKLFNKTFCLFFIATLLLSVAASAQKESVLIRGMVADRKDKLGIPGVSIAELDKDNRIVVGTVTDMNGNFSIKVTDMTHRVSFSFIGYKTIIEDINNRKLINKELESSSVELGAVEITANAKVSNGFLGVDERDLTTAVQTISMKDLEGSSASSIDEALQGRVSGMDVVANSGDPGAGMSIRIRGTSSLSASNAPLIVIDNIPFDTDVDADFDFSTADNERYAQMLNIAPENIKEISILKDAAATSVWGSKAANGVLMITTKRGFKGKPKVQYSLKSTITYQPAPTPLLNGDQFSMMIREAYQNPNGIPMPSTVEEFQYDKTWAYYFDYSQNTDWVAAITQTGHKTQQNLSISGGGEKARYRMSVNYSNAKGTTIGTGASNLTTAFNLDYNVSDKLVFTTDLSYSHGNVDRSYSTDLRAVAFAKLPNQSIYEIDSLGNRLSTYFSPASNSQGSYPDTYNPVAMALDGKSNTINDRIIPKFSLRYDISKIFRYTLDIAFDINDERDSKFLPQDATGKAWNALTVNQTSNKESVAFGVQTFNKFFFSPKLGDNHKFTAMASFTTFDKKSMTYSAVTTNTASIYLQDPIVESRIYSSDGSLGVNNGVTQYRTVAGIVLANYVLLDRYIISGSIRRDGSSKFGSNFQYGSFPSFSGRWRISGEPFMKPVKIISELSLRASYGVNGNSPSKNYMQYSNYKPYSYTVFGEKGIYPSNMELDNLKWEKTIQHDLGLNLVMLDERINIDMDYYLKRTEDQISEDRAVASISGFSTVTMNIGTSDNEGLEFSIFTKIVKSKNYSLDFNFNISRNRNTIRSRPASDLTVDKTNTTVNGKYLYKLQLDNPIGSFYGYRYKGVYTNDAATVAKDEKGNAITDINGNPVRMQFNYPYGGYTFQGGDAIYEDINHDGNINYLDVVYLGNANPLYEGGFGPTFRYRNWSVNAFFHYRVGNDIINMGRMNLEKMYTYDNQSTAVLRRWRRAGDVTDIPRALYKNGYNWLGSDRFVEDGSFLRLKNVIISYSLPKTLIQKLRLTDLKLTLTATNLWTLTNYLGQDPEVSISDNWKTTGQDSNQTPVSREFMIGVNLGF